MLTLPGAPAPTLDALGSFAMCYFEKSICFGAALDMAIDRCTAILSASVSVVSLSLGHPLPGIDIAGPASH
jgi:hypothetical protein